MAIWQGFVALTNRGDAFTEITALVREYVEALLEAQGQTSIQLDQTGQLLEQTPGIFRGTEDPAFMRKEHKSGIWPGENSMTLASSSG